MYDERKNAFTITIKGFTFIVEESMLEWNALFHLILKLASVEDIEDAILVFIFHQSSHAWQGCCVCLLHFLLQGHAGWGDDYIDDFCKHCNSPQKWPNQKLISLTLCENAVLQDPCLWGVLKKRCFRHCHCQIVKHPNDFLGNWVVLDLEMVRYWVVPLLCTRE